MSLISEILDLLYPPKCAFCGTLIGKDCRGICEKCGKSLPFTKNGGKQNGNFFTECLSPLYYEENVREALLRYKFQRRSAYCEAFGSLLAECLAEFLEAEVDMVTWVPLSRKRLRRRGYDQAKLLAQVTARELDLPCVPTLEKAIHTPQQSKTGSAEKRRANVSGAYRVLSGSGISGKTVLLIDDIVTTGATFSECARVLGMAGADRVFCAALARKRDD